LYAYIWHENSKRNFQDLKFTMIKKLFLAALFCGMMMAVQAQKIGHINSQLLLEHMPEYKTASDEMVSYSKQYEDAYKAMEEELNKLFEEYKKVEQSAPKVILETKAQEIQAKEQGLYDFREKASADIASESQRKTVPIKEKADKAIEDVAKANGYTYILDSATGVMLYMGGDDVTKLVCTKLGIPDFTNEAKEAPKK
jgi:outer membrane protein